MKLARAVSRLVPRDAQHRKELASDSRTHTQENSMQSGDFNALMKVAERPPQVFVSGSGSWLVDESGTRYLDFVQGWAVNCLGHCPPELTRALIEQAQRLITAVPAFSTSRRRAWRDCSRRTTASTRCSSATAAPRRTKARSSSRANGARGIGTGRSRSSPSIAPSTAARSPPCRPRASRQWARLFEPKVAGFPKARFGDVARSPA